MSSNKKTANALGGKTARACDSCMKKRARWYCTADDAFLCQTCDASVHSANSLARRHERVRLKTASLKPAEENPVENSHPAWHHGFRRKARTPRHGKPSQHQNKIEEPIVNLPLVPEIGSDEVSIDENEEHLLYRVPIFDPFVAELYASTTPNETTNTVDSATPTTTTPIGAESKIVLHDYGHDGTVDFENLPGLLPSDMDLADFAADVETLLGRGLDEDSFCMEGLGLLDTKEEIYYDHHSDKVKLEEDEEDVKNMVACHQFGSDLDLSRETLDLNFDCDSPTTGEEEEEKVNMTINYGYKGEEKISLRLDYDAVIAAWASQGSPWMNGDRPQFNPNDCWPDSLGTYPAEAHQMYGDMGSMGGHVAMGGDGGREARVSRYREKRRTRLFSKKIRYEVRKLNAEKRPRMKGRFVKRTSFAVGCGGGSSSFPF
ncbi:hypothetical protein AQUCO_02600289v1 [Aquilegia coerulea]|uniref:Uncharacterized protein n=1 Tax=Aquilegia coerulea TaxID=218851 RepID=A0A2G5D8C1_AQUCA|nr:hypothetical protein AQUCO_02600289v1 [Aquilegia coerulea]